MVAGIELKLTEAGQGGQGYVLMFDETDAPRDNVGNGLTRLTRRPGALFA